MDNTSIEDVIKQLENEKQLLSVVQEMTDAERKKVVQNIRNKRQELGMDCTTIDKALESIK